MDFEFGGGKKKPEGGDKLLFDDDSPTKVDDFFSEAGKFQKKSSGSTDDFEHVDHDPFANFSSNIMEPAKASAEAVMKDSTKEFDDFLATSKAKADNVKNDFGNEFSQFTSSVKDAPSNIFSDVNKSINDKVNQVVDFMAAERGSGGAHHQTQPTPMAPFSATAPTPAAVPAPVSVTAAASNLSDVMQSDVKDDDPREWACNMPPLGPAKEMHSSVKDDTEEWMCNMPRDAPKPPAKDMHSAVEDVYDEEKWKSKMPPAAQKSLMEDNEKFISSEDLLGDFKDERTKTPEPVLKQTQPKKVEPIIALAAASVDKKSVEDDDEKPRLPSQPCRRIETVTIVKPEIHAQKMISAEEMFCRFGLDAWFKPERLHPKVESLIYWRDVKKSGIVFGAGLVILLAISCFSVISVFAYLSLLTLVGTVAFRIYKNVIGAVQKTSEGHPFKEYLELDLNLSQDKVVNIVNVAVAHLNGFVSELRRLFLVEDLVDSIKFGVILWVLTYVGAWFNGMTLVILAFVALFTLPKVYENNKQSIDTYLDLVRSKFLEITDKVKAAVPIGKKQETDKEK